MNKQIYPHPIITNRLEEVLLIYSDSWWASYLDVGRKTVMSWRNGYSQPRASQIKTICEVAKVSADWLLGFSEEKRRVTMSSIISNTNIIKRKSPVEAAKELHRNFKEVYRYIDGSLIHKGFDISKLEAEPIAEVIYLNNEPVQVRLLSQSPFCKDSEEVKFGGF